MERRVFLLLIACIIALGTGLSFVPFRVSREFAARRVEVVVDWDDIEWLGKTQGVDSLALLTKLREMGVEAIGVNEYSLRRLKDTGKVVPVAYAGGALYRYFQVPDPKLRETIVRQLTILGKKVDEPEKGIVGMNVLFEEEDKMGLGWNRDLVQFLSDAGFRVVLRPLNRYDLSPEVVETLLQDPVWEKAEGVIFQGDSVLGYGESASLKYLASFLRERKLFFGYLEFVGQKGETTLSSLIPEWTIRVHSIASDELKNYTPATAKERFLRAVKERSVALLYLRAFTDPPSAKSIEKNLTYFQDVLETLRGSGFVLGRVAVPNRPFAVPRLILVLFVVAVALMTLLLWEFFFGFHLAPFLVSLVVLLLGIFLNPIGGMKILGLWAGVVVPTLAVVLCVENFREEKILQGLVLSFLTLFAGAMVVSVGLYHWLFVLRIHQYFGVKVSLALPPLLVLLYLFKSRLLGMSIGQFFLDHLKRFELLILGIVAVGAVLYLTRSGNFPLLPAGSLESLMRGVLERMLFMRPRTKEFLIGYPALWLLSVFPLSAFRPAYQVVLWLAVAVGFTTFLNSFSHLHTPFLFVLLRFGNAVALSIAVFFVYWVVIKVGLAIYHWVSRWGE
ncbi:MAG: hypothetical protein HPY68_04555 [Candidatus Atribacteria bacterium]|nr:hypothetical protein [Candidatus Atribacteria bacterium]